jgi:apolipoprotein N-acyltransferase
LSGAALALAFPRPSLDLLIWVCLVPLIVAVRRTTWPTAFALGWWAGAVAHVIAFPWVLLAVARRQQISMLAGMPSRQFVRATVQFGGQHQRWRVQNAGQLSR